MPQQHKQPRSYAELHSQRAAAGAAHGGGGSSGPPSPAASPRHHAAGAAAGSPSRSPRQHLYQQQQQQHQQQQQQQPGGSPRHRPACRPGSPLAPKAAGRTAAAGAAAAEGTGGTSDCARLAAAGSPTGAGAAAGSRNSHPIRAQAPAQPQPQPGASSPPGAALGPAAAAAAAAAAGAAVTAAAAGSSSISIGEELGSAGRHGTLGAAECSATETQGGGPHQVQRGPAAALETAESHALLSDSDSSTSSASSITSSSGGDGSSSLSSSRAAAGRGSRSSSRRDRTAGGGDGQLPAQAHLQPQQQQQQQQVVEPLLQHLTLDDAAADQQQQQQQQLRQLVEEHQQQLDQQPQQQLAADALDRAAGRAPLLHHLASCSDGLADAALPPPGDGGGADVAAAAAAAAAPATTTAAAAAAAAGAAAACSAAAGGGGGEQEPAAAATAAADAAGADTDAAAPAAAAEAVPGAGADRGPAAAAAAAAGAEGTAAAAAGAGGAGGAAEDDAVAAAVRARILSADPDYELPQGKLTETQVLLAHGSKLRLDRYGFIVSDSGDGHGRPGGAAGGAAGGGVSGSSSARRARSASQVRREQRHVAKWRRMLGGGPAGFEAYAAARPAKVKARVRKGVPDEFRGLVWQLLSGGHAMMQAHPGTYAQLLGHAPDSMDLEIMRDLNRTFPNHVFFHQRQGPGQQALFHVLRAYSALDRQVGYVQGMGFVSAILLMYMSEEAAFWTLVALLKGARRQPPLEGLYQAGMPLLQQCLFQFHGLLKAHSPRLGRHLEGEGVVPSMYCTHWFNTLFAYSLPFEQLLRVWDVFLAEGMKVVFRVGLALLGSAQEQLAGLPFEALVAALNGRRFAILDKHPDVLLRAALRIPVSRHLEVLRRRFQALQAEVQEQQQQQQQGGGGGASGGGGGGAAAVNGGRASSSSSSSARRHLQQQLVAGLAPVPMGPDT